MTYQQALAVAVLTWRPLDEGEPPQLGADTAASFEASSERLSQKLQDSLERNFEAKLAELPNRFQDASDASSRLRSAQRTLDALEERNHFGKVAAKWLARFRPEIDRVAGPESQATEAVPFRLELPAFLFGKLADELRLHR